MHDDSLEDVVVIVVWLVLLFINNLCTLLFSQVLSRVFAEIQVLRELAVIIYLEFYHLFIIKLESFQGDYKVIWKLLQADSLHCWNFLAASFAEVSIIAIKSITFDHSIKALIDILLSLDSQANREEMFFCLREVRTSFADNLVRVNSSEHILDKCFLLGWFELILDSIKENVGKFVDVHLLWDICWIAVIIFEGMTKFFWIVELFIAVS